MRFHYRTIINNYLNKKVSSLILQRKRFNANDVIIVFAEARGGSTWLMEILMKIPNVCINWEPLHFSGVVPNEFNFSVKPYIYKEDRSTNFISFFKDVHTLKISNKWTRKYITLYSAINCNQIITKYVNASLLIPWFMENFEFRHKPIILLRHPIDTTISHIKAFGKNKGYLDELEYSSLVHNKKFKKDFDYINGLSSILEKRIAFWCMNNSNTIQKLNDLDVCVVFYSDLLINPKKEIKNILKNSNLKINEKDLDSMNFRKASKTNFKGDFINDPLKQLNKNFKNLEKEKKDRIQKIFDYYDLKLYSAYSPLPKKEYINN